MDLCDAWREASRTGKVAVPDPGRVRYWADRGRHVPALPLPEDWIDRMAGWNAGCVFIVNDDPGAPPLGGVVPERGGLPDAARPCPGAGSVGLVVAASDQRTVWAYSHRAMYFAARAWYHWDIAEISGLPKWGNWLNGIPGFSGSRRGYRCPSPVPGFSAAAVDGDVILFHPRVLGPVGRYGAGGELEVSPGLWAQRFSDRPGVGVRAESVPDGWWRDGVVHPVIPEAGWWTLD